MRTNSKMKSKADRKRMTRITVGQLRSGDRIVTVRVADKLTGEVFCVKSEKVTKVDECPGSWRTHIHINKKDCYDLRSLIDIVAE